MDLSVNTIHVSYTWDLKLLLLFLAVYPWPVLAFLGYRIRRSGELPLSLANVLYLPGFLASAVTWAGFGRLVEGTQVSGSFSLASRAAALAEAHLPLFLGAVAGGVTSIGMWLIVRRRPSPTSAVPRLWLLSVFLLSVSGMSVGTAWWLVQAETYSGTTAVAVTIGTLVSLLAAAAVVVSAFRTSVSTNTWAPILAAMSYFVVGVAAWCSSNIHEQIAKGLHAA